MCYPDFRPFAWRRMMIGGLLLLVTLFGSGAAAAQVGHSPPKSPYRDIRRGHTLTALAGQLGGDGGQLGIGPHDGVVIGARYDFRTSHTLQIGFAVESGEFDRLIVDPFVPLAGRTSGPVQQRITFAETDVQFNLTGGKTWYHLAPFIGAGLGLTFASGTPADTSGYNFGTKFYFAPHAGVRIFLTKRIHLRAEARTVFWKLSYPNIFLQEQSGTVAVVTDGQLTEWITTSWLQLGVGFGIWP